MAARPIATAPTSDTDPSSGPGAQAVHERVDDGGVFGRHDPGLFRPSVKIDGKRTIQALIRIRPASTGRCGGGAQVYPCATSASTMVSNRRSEPQSRPQSCDR